MEQTDDVDRPRTKRKSTAPPEGLLGKWLHIGRAEIHAKHVGLDGRRAIFSDSRGRSWILARTMIHG
jgi:hypothetical protein